MGGEAHEVLKVIPGILRLLIILSQYQCSGIDGDGEAVAWINLSCTPTRGCAALEEFLPCLVLPAEGLVVVETGCEAVPGNGGQELICLGSACGVLGNRIHTQRHREHK